LQLNRAQITWLINEVDEWIERKVQKVKAIALAFFSVVAINLKFFHNNGSKCNTFFGISKLRVSMLVER